MSNKLRAHIDRLVTTPGLELSRWARFIRFQVQLWRTCARRLWENNVMAMSAALSFRTIFALVPILVLGFVMLKSVGALEASKAQLRHFLASSGFQQITIHREPSALQGDQDSEPAGQEAVDLASQIEMLVARVENKLTLGKIGPVGVVLLVWSAMTLVGTVERSLNRIFRVRQARSFKHRIVFHWSAVTLGPMALAAASYGGERLSAASADAPALSWLFMVVGWAGPIVAGVVFVATLYKLIPNAHIATRSAIGGALVSVLLWLVAKWAFRIYVEEVVGTGNVYGTLGLLPLFLIWLNFSWWIFLFGAQLAHAAAHLDQIQSADSTENIVLGAADLLAAAVAIAQPYSVGSGPVSTRQVQEVLRLPGESVDWLIDRLEKNGVICPTGDSEARLFVPTRPPHLIAVLDILELSENSTALSRQDRSCGSQSRYTERIAIQMDEFHGHAKSVMGSLMLADVIKAGRSAAK